ncbi:MAG: DUF1800 domain-containing protein [Chloroflexi bacterium]|nr:DUF1800 domain-containing protein [Chloroflexota bacterium]
MQITRRDFLKDITLAAAVVGLPGWAINLDEAPPATLRASAPAPYPWQWTPPQNLGQGSPTVTALNRIAFGPRPGDFERVQAIGVDTYIEEQLAPATIDDSALEQQLAKKYPTLKMSAVELYQNYPQPAPVSPQERAFRAFRAGEQGIKPQQLPGPQDVIQELQEATILRAIFSRRQLQETLADHWSNHFAMFIGKDAVKWMKTVDDREVIRKHALGKFGDMLLASAQSPAMLAYLDNHLNVKGVPNENYAREIMELHSLGVDGGYTQKDVQELARVLTGWTVKQPRRALLGGMDYTDAGQFIFNANQHDTGAKIVLGVNFSGKDGINEGLKMVDVLAHHPSTAKFVTKRLIMRYIADTPPPDLWNRAAQTFTQTKGDLRATLSVILHSDDFKNSFAQKIKRPFELVASMARATDMQVEEMRPFNATIRAMGQGLFLLLTPDGYPDTGTAWINTGALLARWNLALITAYGRVPQAKVDFKAAMSGANIKTVANAVDFWIERILHRAIPDKDRQKLIAALGANANANFDIARLPDLVALILASPHFQYR